MRWISRFAFALLLLISLSCKPQPPPAQASLHKVIGCDNSERTVDIVFLHGVDGHHLETWHPSKNPDAYWPRWIGEDRPDFGIWALDYPAATSSWKGETMALVDRARNVLSHLTADGFADNPDRPLIFICHSFGGLVAKQLLERAEESPKGEWRTILYRTNGVVFIATPNSGSNLADFVDFVANRLSLLGKLTTITAEELKSSSPNLLKLNSWYRNHAPSEYGIRTQVFCEKQKTGHFLVVPEASADPAIPGVEPDVLDRNHLNICKPTNRNDVLYKQVLRFLDDSFDMPPPCDMPNPKLSVEQGGCPSPPSEEALTRTSDANRENPELVVLSYENKTGKKLDLALYDWSRSSMGHRGVWRYLESPPNGREKRYEDFVNDTKETEEGVISISSGWFSVYVVTPGCEVSPCLFTGNLFAGKKPRIVLAKPSGKMTATLSFDP